MRHENTVRMCRKIRNRIRRVPELRPRALGGRQRSPRRNRDSGILL